jgi:hypothetical protein
MTEQSFDNDLSSLSSYKSSGSLKLVSNSRFSLNNEERHHKSEAYEAIDLAVLDALVDIGR